MKHVDLRDLGHCSDILLSRRHELITVRFAAASDVDLLQGYFRGLSTNARYNRLMGASRELPAGQLDRFIHAGEDNGYSLVATTQRDGLETIVGEARYVINDADESVEIGLSIDNTMQRQGLGAALLNNLECRATALGGRHLFGDTLRSNDAMLALARKSGFTLVRSPGDWKQVRFIKQIGAVDHPAASWLPAAVTASASAVV